MRAPGANRKGTDMRSTLAGPFVTWVVAVLASGCSPDGEDSSRSSPSPPARSRQDHATAAVPAPLPSAGPAAGAGGLKSRLRPQYLAGEWCAIFSQERSRYVFGPDGSFRRALPGADLTTGAEYGIVHDLLEDFHVVREVEADRFVLARGGRGHRGYVFRRGPC